MVKKKTMKWLAAGGLVLGVALMGGTAGATNLHVPFVDSSTTIYGSVTQFFGDTQPWVAELFSNGGECMFLQVVSQATDLEMVVTAPNGAVYRNDDGLTAPCLTCPLVKIASTPNNGWYTVSLSHRLGTAVSANFELFYGLYTLGTGFCSPSTLPLNSLEPDQGKPQAADAR